VSSLAPEAVAPFLRGRFGGTYRFEPECESTQALLLGTDLPEGAVAATDHQTAGRGRLGRRWEAPAGSSVLASVLLHPPEGRAWAELALVGGVAAAMAVEDVTELYAQVKWPNDVMLDRRKVAGVLAEARDGVVVLGIGMNVNQTRAELPVDASTEAASLRTVSGSTYDVAKLLGALLSRLEALYDAWLEGGLEAIYVDLGARNFLFGRRVRVDGREGAGGVIGHDGRLEVHLDGGETLHVESGEVEYVR
jgi:BirA family transcriptional regulator, biotin operon repressor / biotin---[acetyl-CoA-carboxylase] ligase